VAESHCHDVILGLPFSHPNHLLIDAHEHTVVCKLSGFDLMNPTPIVTQSPPRKPLKQLYNEVIAS
jgi:hypothetical protein